MDIFINPPDVLPPGFVRLEDGSVVLRGFRTRDEILRALDGIEATTTEEFVRLATESGRFAPSQWGAFPAVELKGETPEAEGRAEENREAENREDKRKRRTKEET